MSWLSRLYHTYEQVKDNADAQLHYALMPYYHVKQNVQIIVTINDKGDFVSARLARDGNGKLKSLFVTVPATNDSASRAGKYPSAHPLSDKIQYLAKSYQQVYENHDFHAEYIGLLKNWAESNSSHKKVKAVLEYLTTHDLIEDLVKSNILILNEDGILATPKNASEYSESIFAILNKKDGYDTYDQGSAFVVWEVIDSDLTTVDVIETWKDNNLFIAWQNYYASLDSKDGFCHITGKNTALASKHPKGILRSSNNAKLISANDMDGFTFRGRFTDDKNSIKNGYQAVNISAEVTEKAHAALAWLLTSQGHEESGQAMVAWAIDGSKIPQPYKPIVPQAMIEDAWSDFDSEEFADIDDSDEIEEQSSKLHHHKDIGSQFAHNLKKTMQGYRQKLTDNDQISVISLDSATPGRMAVTYYYEAMPDDYLTAIADWYDNFAWYAFYFDKETNQKRMTIQAPTPYQIAVSAYGSRVSDAVKKQVVSQVLPVIVEGHYRQIPKTLMDLCVKHACNPLGLENWEWEQNLSVACSLYRGYYNRLKNDKKRSYTVALQENYTSRDYLYGRLLAIAEDIESLALYVAGENRVTTAQRYMQQFANRPFSTWRNIELSLDPYMKRLKNNRPDYLFNKQNLLNDVMSKFDINDFNNNTPLSGEFLLGYHCQKMAFYLAKQTKKTDEKTDTNQKINA